MKTYKKTRKNPLGLGVTTITNDSVKYPNGTFTDADITDKDKAKLELAIKSGMVVEVNTELEDAKAKEELLKSADDLEASQLRVKELEAQLKKCDDDLEASQLRVKELEAQLKKCDDDLEAQLKKCDDDLEASQLRVKELEAQLKKCDDLKAFAYELMDADELAKFYTVDELKEIATKLEIDFKANEKEASLASKIVEKLEK